jgi:hypothetical protein
MYIYCTVTSKISALVCFRMSKTLLRYPYSEKNERKKLLLCRPKHTQPLTFVVYLISALVCFSKSTTVVPQVSVAECVYVSIVEEFVSSRRICFKVVVL